MIVLIFVLKSIFAEGAESIDEILKIRILYRQVDRKNGEPGLDRQEAAL